MFERSYDIFFVIQFDRIIELKFDSNLNFMKINKNSKDSKEKKMKINNKQKIIHLLSISELESKRYDVEILNQQAFEEMTRSNINLIRLEDSSLFNQQKKSVSAETSRSNQKFSSFFSSSSEINEQTTNAFKRLRFLSTFRILHNINSEIDQSNILSERMKKKI